MTVVGVAARGLPRHRLGRSAVGLDSDDDEAAGHAGFRLAPRSPGPMAACIRSSETRHDARAGAGGIAAMVQGDAAGRHQARGLAPRIRGSATALSRILSRGSTGLSWPIGSAWAARASVARAPCRDGAGSAPGVPERREPVSRSRFRAPEGNRAVPGAWRVARPRRSRTPGPVRPGGRGRGTARRGGRADRGAHAAVVSPNRHRRRRSVAADQPTGVRSSPLAQR